MKSNTSTIADADQQRRQRCRGVVGHDLVVDRHREQRGGERQAVDQHRRQRDLGEQSRDWPRLARAASRRRGAATRVPVALSHSPAGHVWRSAAVKSAWAGRALMLPSSVTGSASRPGSSPVRAIRVNCARSRSISACTSASRAGDIILFGADEIDQAAARQRGTVRPWCRAIGDWRDRHRRGSAPRGSRMRASAAAASALRSASMPERSAAKPSARARARASAMRAASAPPSDSAWRSTIWPRTS